MENEHCFCLADDAVNPLSPDANGVATEAVIQGASGDDGILPDQSIDRPGKAVSIKCMLMAHNGSVCPSTNDDDDDRVLFNADIICSEHGEYNKYNNSKNNSDNNNHYHEGEFVPISLGVPRPN